MFNILILTLLLCALVYCSYKLGTLTIGAKESQKDNVCNELLLQKQLSYELGNKCRNLEMQIDSYQKQCEILQDIICNSRQFISSLEEKNKDLVEMCGHWKVAANFIRRNRTLTV